MYRIAVAAVLVIMSVSGAFAGTRKPSFSQRQLTFDTHDFLYGKDPGKNVGHWIRLTLFAPIPPGPHNFFLSYRIISGREFIRMPPAQYKMFVKYTRDYRCVPIKDEAVPDLMMEVTEYAKGRSIRLCRMSQADACPYMDGIFRLPSMKFEAADVKLLGSVDEYFGCHSPNIKRGN